MTATNRTSLIHVLDALNGLRIRGTSPASIEQVSVLLHSLLGHAVVDWQLRALLSSACRRGLASQDGDRWAITKAGVYELHILFGGMRKENIHE